MNACQLCPRGLDLPDLDMCCAHPMVRNRLIKAGLLATTVIAFGGVVAYRTLVERCEEAGGCWDYRGHRCDPVISELCFTQGVTWVEREWPPLTALGSDCTESKQCPGEFECMQRGSIAGLTKQWTWELPCKPRLSTDEPVRCPVRSSASSLPTAAAKNGFVVAARSLTESRPRCASGCVWRHAHFKEALRVG
jgi:hypothetical protein